MIKTNDTNCPIVKFKIIETSDDAHLLELSGGCPTGFDNSDACRKITVHTNVTRIIDEDPPELKFTIVAVAKDGRMVSFPGNTIQIKCSKLVVISMNADKEVLSPTF